MCDANVLDKSNEINEWVLLNSYNYCVSIVMGILIALFGLLWFVYGV